MARANFVERSFRCSVCGATFKALTDKHKTVAEPVCMDCGLKYSPERRLRLTEERKRRTRGR
ncbi:hypothetical protein [Anaeromyxobacter sp. SG26]|uniref:hypothetical protein n=1 Tax=Anaeromyxobacter sp. SG26 TaxID=2925407 RepID=UPI001F564EBE|nr:hypothetical protein [Anaeromyxobacter sp. SG26]